MIKVAHLTKTYPGGKGIFDISFEVASGEVFGFLGPNGAGKTTTIRQLLGFTNAEYSCCTINGRDCRRETETIHEQLGYLPGETAFLDGMSGTQFIKFMSGLRRNLKPVLLDDLLQRFELDPEVKIRRMSKGTRQKLALIVAFMHDPQLLLLDEPTNGLDPLMQQRFIELILERKQLGRTIFMSSHYFDEVERSCDRAAILKDGRIVAIEDIATLRAARRKTFMVTFAAEKDFTRLLASSLETGEPEGLRCSVSVGSDFSPLFKLLADSRVTAFESSSDTLEEVFISYYGREAK